MRLVNLYMELCVVGWAMTAVACTTPQPQDAGRDAAPDVIIALDTGVPDTGATDDVVTADVLDAGALEDTAVADAQADVNLDANAPACTVDAGPDARCVPCPRVSDEIINQCTTHNCSPFNNARVTRLLPDGGLPPLP